MFFVYCIKNLINEKLYIGVTNKSSVKKRFVEHIYSAEKRNSHYRIHAAIRKYGKENFIIYPIHLCTDKETAIELETFYIEKFNTFSKFGYNSNPGGFGLLYHTEESKEKMSLNNFWRGKDRSGAKAPFFGRTHTDEVKQTISETNKNNKYRLGQKCSEKVKKLLSDGAKERFLKFGSPRKGAIFTKEHCENISKGKMGQIAFVYTWEITDPSGNVHIVENLKEYCRINSLHNGNMYQVAKGKLGHHKNYRVRKLTDSSYK